MPITNPLRIIGSMFVLVLVPLLPGCSPEGLAGNAQLPTGVPDPNSTHTPAGALAAYEGALLQLRTAVGGDPTGAFIAVSGLFTDELQSSNIGLAGYITDDQLVDSRVLPEYNGNGTDRTAIEVVDVYGLLQQVRGQAQEARGLLQAYAPKAPRALAGHLDALEGYADIFLADLFCSGIPLSTLDYGKDFTYQPGSSTQLVYQRAEALFDSALALVGDSARIVNMARVGKGRALLALGQYAAAATAVAQVPTDYQYVLQFNTALTSGGAGNNPISNQNFAYLDFGGSQGSGLTMVDREGENGLPFMSSSDPRSAWVANGTNSYGVPLARPAMYDPAGDSPIVMASGIEARLIEAEAALQAGSGDWLTTLNALRTDGTYSTQPDSANPAQTDTLWNAGTGGVAGLRPLTDPGDATARVRLLFDERGYWLFLTGHRQGDLRRLIRRYGLPQEQVYPVGPYPGAYNSYGTAVTAPIPGAERISNPMFKGCFNRSA